MIISEKLDRFPTLNLFSNIILSYFKFKREEESLLQSRLDPATDPGGGGRQRGHGPLSLLKLVIKKMATIRSILVFMLLAPPPPLTILDPMPGPFRPKHEGFSLNGPSPRTSRFIQF